MDWSFGKDEVDLKADFQSRIAVVLTVLKQHLILFFRFFVVYTRLTLFSIIQPFSPHW